MLQAELAGINYLVLAKQPILHSFNRMNYAIQIYTLQGTSHVLTRAQLLGGMHGSARAANPVTPIKSDRSSTMGSED